MSFFAKAKEILRDNEGNFRCPYCNRELGSYIDENLKDMNQILAIGARTDIITRQGITCSCGKKLKPYQQR